MARPTAFESLSHIAETLEGLASTLRRIDKAAHERAQHAEIERLEEHLEASELDVGALQEFGSEALDELGDILKRLGRLVRPHHSS